MSTSWTNNLTEWLLGSGNGRTRELLNWITELMKKTHTVKVPPNMSNAVHRDSLSTLNADLISKPQISSTLMSDAPNNTYESIHFQNTDDEDNSKINNLESVTEKLNLNQDSNDSNVEIRKPTSFKLHRSSFSIYEPPPTETVSSLDDSREFLSLPFYPRHSLPANPKIEKPKRKHLPSKTRNLQTASLNSSINTVDNDLEDSRIIQDIVVDKYSDVLDRFRHRSIRRLSQKRNCKYGDFVNDNGGYDFLSVSLPSIITSNDCPPGCKHNNFDIDDLPLEVRDLAKRLLRERSIMDDDSFSFGSCMSNKSYHSQSFLKAALGSDLSCDTKYSSFASLSFQEELEDDMNESSDLLEALPKGKHLANVNMTVEELKKELSVQEEVILQTSKALQFCKTSKKFALSREQIEAERILLISIITKDVLTEEIQRKTNLQLITDQEENGYIRISKIVFPFKQLLVDDGNNRSKDVEQFFVCILKCGIRVLASKVLVAQNGILNIDTDFVFSRLTKKFLITIYVYCLKTKTKSSSSHEKRLLKIKNKVPSPKKIFSLSRDSLKNCMVHQQVRPSSFLLLGKFSINKDNFRERNFKMATMSKFTILDEAFNIDMESKVFLRNRLQGFLTIAIVEGECAIWNRWWCSLFGYKLKYWNYPSEDTINNPIGLIDLRQCTSQEIGPADRSLCARQKTLLLKIKQKGTIINHFLSCDNLEDLKNWQTQLNYVIKSIRDWNCAQD